jgi:hypothetical protein
MPKTQAEKLAEWRAARRRKALRPQLEDKALRPEVQDKAWTMKMSPEDYLERYPEGPNADLARKVLGQ